MSIEENVREVTMSLHDTLSTLSNIQGLTWGELFQGYAFHLCNLAEYLASWGDEGEDTSEAKYILEALLKTSTTIFKKYEADKVEEFKNEPKLK
jgi:hypothetical protein